MTRLLSAEGRATEVALLASGSATIEQTDHDEWNGGQYGYTVTVEIPEPVYLEHRDSLPTVEEFLANWAKELTRVYGNQWIQSFKFITRFSADAAWQEKALAWVSGQGLTNQGRAHSDHLPPKMVDGLLFRSLPEIYLYRALKRLGITLAPLAVFVRGGKTYRRIEPDFFIVKDGIMLVVEVDGDTVHRESPREAHDRLTILTHEGVHVERVNASECDTTERASECANRILNIIEKLKTNK
jgi:hypothetical protein